MKIHEASIKQSHEPTKGGSVLILGAGNGAVNILSELDKDHATFTDEDIQHGLLKMIATDPDNSKLEEGLKGSTRVTKICLIENHLFAEGTGADILRGAQYALDNEEYFRSMAEQHAAINGNALFIGCLGGGSTAILPIVAKIFINAGVRVRAIVTMPEITLQGGDRINNANVVLRALQTAGVSCIVIHNNRAARPQGIKTRERYASINQGFIIPLLGILRSIYQETGSVRNIDTTDLRGVEGTTQYVSYVQCGTDLISVERIVEMLTNHPLQDAKKIIPVATRAIIDYHGAAWTVDTMDRINTAIHEKMPKHMPTSLKDGETEIDRFGDIITPEKSWVGFITSANVLGEEPENMPKLEQYYLLMAKVGVPQQKLDAGSEDGPAAPQLPESAPSVALQPLMVDEKDCVAIAVMIEGLAGTLMERRSASIKVPIDLQKEYARMKPVDSETNKPIAHKLTLAEILDFQERSGPYVQRSTNLVGWEIYFHEKANLVRPQLVTGFEEDRKRA